MRSALLLLVAACGDNRTREAADASVDTTVADAPVDTGPCSHGQATTPSAINGRSFASFQRAGTVTVFAGDPWPAILIEAGPIARCACDAPPAGGAGNTLITVITDWPIRAGAAEIIGVYMHEDAGTQAVGGSGSMMFTQVTPTSAAGTMTVQFPGDPAPVQIAFDAPNCNTYQ